MILLYYNPRTTKKDKLMKLTRRILALLLAALMAFCLCACGNNTVEANVISNGYTPYVNGVALTGTK